MNRDRLIGLYVLLLVAMSASGRVLTDSVAQDFTMATRDGRTLRLSELAADRWTLLMFYDPDCSDCRQELFAMRHASALRRAVSEERLRVVCVYAEQDETLWRDSCAELPEAWTVAIAHSDVHTSYDLSAMPLLLLLDRQRHVIGQAYELRDLPDLSFLR